MTNALHRHLVTMNPSANPMPAFFKTGDETQRLTLFYAQIEPFKVRYFAYTKEDGAFTIGNRLEAQALAALTAAEDCELAGTYKEEGSTVVIYSLG